MREALAIPRRKSFEGEKKKDKTMANGVLATCGDLLNPDRQLQSGIWSIVTFLRRFRMT